MAGKSKVRPGDDSLDVFMNFPFDPAYQPILHAMLYTVIRSGFRARCALETDDSAQNRLEKICDIIDDCRFGVHDISRTETSGDPPLPRFNMPLELGLFMGAKRYGKPQHRRKACIIFDREEFRFRKFISDIAGMDIHIHNDDPETAIRKLTAWLRLQPGGLKPGGGQFMIEEYRQFEKILPDFCASKKMTVGELAFGDLNDMITEYVQSLAAA